MQYKQQPTKQRQLPQQDQEMKVEATHECRTTFSLRLKAERIGSCHSYKVEKGKY